MLFDLLMQWDAFMTRKLMYACKPRQEIDVDQGYGRRRTWCNADGSDVEPWRSKLAPDHGGQLLVCNDIGGAEISPRRIVGIAKPVIETRNGLRKGALTGGGKYGGAATGPPGQKSVIDQDAQRIAYRVPSDVKSLRQDCLGRQQAPNRVISVFDVGP
jgi:hypothetical protein